MIQEKVHDECAIYIKSCNDTIFPNTFDYENACLYWIDSNLPNLQRIALIVLKSVWNDTEAQ